MTMTNADNLVRLDSESQHLDRVLVYVEGADALANGTPYVRGTVWVNCYDASDGTVPFGGYGESGIGRDKSLHALDKPGHIETTWMQL